MKNYKKIMLPAFIMALALASCEKSDKEPWNPDAPTISNGAYVLNQGNSYNHIEGSLNVIDYTNFTSSLYVFKGANGRTLGDTPQCGVAYGTKLYIGMNDSHTIEIVDRSSYRSLKQIRLDDVEFKGKSPRSMVANDGFVYISMFEGYVAKLDTLSAAITAEVKVGPNPEVICLHKGNLYVPNSDGNNYMVGYGKTASVINVDSFTVTNTFETGLNPYQFFSDGNKLFLLCRGDYGATPGMLYAIDSDLKGKEIAKATLAGYGAGKLYFVDQPYPVTTENADYKIYDTASGKITDWKIERPDYASAIAVDELSGKLLISSYKLKTYVNPDGSSSTGADYDAPGYVNVYNSSSYSFESKYGVGSGPACIFFNSK